jgi:dolichol kinase
MQANSNSWSFYTTSFACLRHHNVAISLQAFHINSNLLFVIEIRKRKTAILMPNFIVVSAIAEKLLKKPALQTQAGRQSTSKLFIAV